MNNIKDLLPYLLLVAIYFFFINLEANNNQNKFSKSYEKIDQNEKQKNNITVKDENKQRIRIPVIPYEL